MVKIQKMYMRTILSICYRGELLIKDDIKWEIGVEPLHSPCVICSPRQ